MSRSGLNMLLIFVTATFVATSSLRAEKEWLKDSQARLEAELVSKYGEEQRARLQRGMDQVASLWRDEDGGAAGFEEFMRRSVYR